MEVDEVQGLHELAELEQAAAAALAHGARGSHDDTDGAPSVKRPRLDESAVGYCGEVDDDIFDVCCDLGESAYFAPVAAAAVAVTPVVAWVPASLDGIEERLAGMGEVPLFRPTGASYLEHQCRTLQANVRYWPNTLQWSVEGPHREAVEAALLAPVPGVRVSSVPVPPPPPPCGSRRA